MLLFIALLILIAVISKSARDLMKGLLMLFFGGLLLLLF
jgi:hypothetical protein